MIVFEGRGLGDIYLKVFRYIEARGQKVTVRGKRCIEIPEPVTLVYTHPGYCWMNMPNRKFNPFFALAEVVWILQGRGDIDWIAPYNERMREFNDGLSDNHGAYGIRIRKARGLATIFHDGEEIDQILMVVQKLKADPTTRQAIMTLWDPALDNSKSKDIPCNNWVGYKLRNGVLDQTVVIRSNDFIWGTPYNAVQFTHLHALVAGELGAQMGTLTYAINNLHYYLDEYPSTLGTVQEEAAWVHSSLEALCAENFRPVKDAEQMRIVPIISNEPNRDYWKDTIPKMMGLYTLIKKLPLEANLPMAVEMYKALPSPFQVLAYDLLKGSTSAFVKRMLIQIEK